MYELSNGLLWTIFGVIFIMSVFTWISMYNYMQTYRDNWNNNGGIFGLTLTTLLVLLMSWLIVGLTLDSMIH